MLAAKSRYLSIELQERDIALLRTLLESRIMTSAHVAGLHFAGKAEATKKRLQTLKAAGFVGERKRRAFEPSVLFLTRKAFKLLGEHGILAEYPLMSLDTLEKRARVSEMTIRHELEVMDVKTAFHVALRQTPDFTIEQFRTWPLLYQFEAARGGYGGVDVLVKPDGFIRIHEKEKDGGLSEHAFFLEVDRSSETQEYLVTRAGCYFQYYKSGGFAHRNGASHSEFKDYPFRVLMVFKTAERRNNTAESLLSSNPPIFTQACLSTLAEVMENPFGEIWIRPAEYRDITTGTAFDVERKTPTWGYKRQTERELLVERSIKKFSILL